MVDHVRRFHAIPIGEPRLLEGARLFNAGEFFESHEVWESLWHEVDGPERELLQGMIQIAAAFHHLVRGNIAGARYLYDRGRRRLFAHLPSRAGVLLVPWISQIDERFGLVAAGHHAVTPPLLTIAP